MATTRYVQRDVSGVVVGVFANPQPGFAEETLPADDAAIAAYLAPRPVPPTPREWLERLPAEKQQAITAAASADAALLLWLLKAAGASVIDVTLAETQEGVAALVAAGVLTADDEALLLAP